MLIVVIFASQLKTQKPNEIKSFASCSIVSVYGRERIQRLVFGFRSGTLSKNVINRFVPLYEQSLVYS